MRAAKPKPASPVIDRLIAQSKQITADLCVLKHEIGQAPLSPLTRGGRIAEERIYLVGEQIYRLQHGLNELHKQAAGKAEESPSEHAI